MIDAHSGSYLAATPYKESDHVSIVPVLAPRVRARRERFWRDSSTLLSVSDTNTLSLARHYLDVDRPEEALKTLERAESEQLNEPEYWWVRSAALHDLERYSEGANAARSGLEHEAEDVDLLAVLGLCELGLNNFGEAEKALTQALAMSPNNAVLHAYRALVRAHRGNGGAARADVAEARHLDPDSLLVLRVRAQVAARTGDDAASEYVDDLLSRDPESKVGHALRGNLALERERYVSASRAFSEAARLDPADHDVARAAREARVPAHPVLAPVRLVWRFGRWRSYFLFLTLAAILAAVGLESVRVGLMIAWLSIVALSWVGPWLLRWWQRRRYGDFGSH
jgi:tetratricopeptide (TPR) repeat protein